MTEKPTFREAMERAQTHSLKRTSPKGERFIGVCVQCGEANLPMSAAQEECPNQRGVTREDAIMEAMRHG